MRLELEYYFGENWTTDMYDFIEDHKMPRTQIDIKPLQDLI